MPVQTPSNPTLETLDSTCQSVLKSFADLLRLANATKAVQADFDNVLGLLETLPLSTSEYGVARLRLDNANRYRMASEHGAAAWEIRTVMLQLKSQFSTVAPNPSRRRIRSLSPLATSSDRN
jgi:hypothetical protein